MAALPYIQLYVADYLADTMHLTTEDHGAYLLLIFNYWQTGKAIPKKRLPSVTRMSNERWADVEETLKEFFIETPTGEWFHPRIEADLERVNSKHEQTSEAGKESARRRAAKKEKEKQAQAVVSEREINGRSTDVEIPLQRNANHLDTDPDPDPEAEPEKEKTQRGKSCSGPKTAAAPAPDPGTGLALVNGSKGVATKALNGKIKAEAKTGQIWAAYSTAYFNRYGAEPVRNAKINGQLAQVVDRLGADEAPHVAACYVASGNQFYVLRRHSVDCLLRDCESLRTEWATGTRITATEARHMDEHQTSAENAKWLRENMDNLRAARREGKI